MILNKNFYKWVDRLKNNVSLKKVLQYCQVSRNNSNNVFTFLDTKIESSDGYVFNRCLLLCPDSVVVIPILFCFEDNEYYTLLVEQIRIVDGGNALEFAAGSIEDGQNYKTAACKEAKEELNIEIKDVELHLLTKDPLKINPSFSSIELILPVLKRGKFTLPQKS